MGLSKSPLRYPGGKTKLYPLVSPIISGNIDKGIYIEPFAGGAGLALKLLYSNEVSRIVLNDFDYSIYCFWYACLYDTKSICEKIEKCDITISSWKYQKHIYSSYLSYSKTEVGFATFFLNRCNISGVIKGGPIGGFDQKGSYLIDARFNKVSLIDKIQKIGSLRESIDLYNENASFFLQVTLNKYPVKSTFLNIDPPYVKKGKMLYENSFTQGDHTELYNVISDLKYKWIVTYDECDLIYNLYAKYRKQSIVLNYSAGQTKKGSEILITSDDIIL